MAQIPNRVNGPGLRRLRQQRGIKPAELASRVPNLSTPHLRNIETGHRQGSWEVLHLIARELGVDVSDLLTDHGRDELTAVATR